MNPAEDLLAHKNLFRKLLREWYLRNHRPLPWRKKPSLYKTVVSEFMLQQTQVVTVVPYFLRWMKELPSFTQLAKAPADKVLKLWEGLGYYSRARNLQSLARSVVKTRKIPKDVTSWQTLPGVGPYTASAIASIAFDTPAAVVDGNVVRVLSRLSAHDGVFESSSQAVKYFSKMSRALLNRREPGNHNQAVMELGATVCLRRKPLCLLCPVRRLCGAYRSGNPEMFPSLTHKQTKQLTVERLWVLRGSDLLLERIPETAKRLAQIYELPRKEAVGPFAENPTLLAVKSRAISNQQIEERIYAYESQLAGPLGNAAPNGLKWVALSQLDSVVISGPHRRWITELLDRPKTADSTTEASHWKKSAFGRGISRSR